LQQLKKDLENAESEKQLLTHEWTHLWQPLGINHRSPREMAQWTNDFKLLVQKVKDLRTRRTKSNQLQKHIDAHRMNLIQHLDILETNSNHNNDSLTTLIKKSQSIIADEEELLRKREQLLRDKKKLENEIKAAKFVWNPVKKI
jgi:hypothetical protein